MSVKQGTTGICASVITYHPEPECLANIVRAAAQVDRLLVVDNHSSESVQADLMALADEHHLDLIRNDSNFGVAAALDQAIEWAKANRFEWLLTLDQDTVPHDDMVDQLRLIGESAGDRREIAIIGSNYLDGATGVPFASPDRFEGREWREETTVITSGSLLSLQACEEIGRFRDDYFIDYVDDEYCLRARKLGYRVLLSRAVVMEHAVGSPVHGRRLGRDLISPSPAPDRQYYRTRNLIALAREYRRSERMWVRRAIRTRAKEIVLVLLLERHKLRKLARACLGLVHGLCGRMGALRKEKRALRADL